MGGILRCMSECMKTTSDDSNKKYITIAFFLLFSLPERICFSCFYSAALYKNSTKPYSGGVTLGVFRDTGSLGATHNHRDVGDIIK